MTSLRFVPPLFLLAAIAAPLGGCARSGETSGETEDAVRRRDGGADGSAAAVVRLAAAVNHTCAIRGGALYCWGTNEKGQLGDGTLETRRTPVAIATGATWIGVATAATHTCALRAEGTLWCWGSGDRPTPKQVNGWTDWKQIAVGDDRTCAIRGDGSLYCWTDGAVVAAPERFGADSDWASVAVSTSHACGVRTSGALDCWGSNAWGELGVRGAPEDGTLVRSPTTDWADVSPGGDGLYAYTCGRRRDQSLWCWGYAVGNRLGLGESPPREGGRVTTAKWNAVVTSRQSQGSYIAHTCGIRADRSLYCWGWNENGQAGDPAIFTIPRPLRLGAESDWTALALGGEHTCGARADGSVWCWGANASGQLGFEGAGGTPQRVRFPDE